MSEQQQQPPSFEIVHGTPIVFTSDEIAVLDDTFGVPQRVAEAVSEQIFTAIAGRQLQPENLRFSGYFDAEDIEHVEKSTGDFAGEEGAHDYFFTDFEALKDGEEGPLAYAATVATPAVGVYDKDRLLALDYDELNEVVNATPEALLGALLFEFRPEYVIP